MKQRSDPLPKIAVPKNHPSGTRGQHLAQLRMFLHQTCVVGAEAHRDVGAADTGLCRGRSDGKHFRESSLNVGTTMLLPRSASVNTLHRQTFRFAQTREPVSRQSADPRKCIQRTVPDLFLVFPFLITISIHTFTPTPLQQPKLTTTQP